MVNNSEGTEPVVAGHNVQFQERWVAKLIAHLAVTTALWVQIQRWIL